MSTLKGFIVGCCVSAAAFSLLPSGTSEQGIGHAVAVPAATGARSAPDFTLLLERVGPSVVHVTTRSFVRDAADVAQRHYDVYRGLGSEEGKETVGRTVTGLGSGFVLGHDGYILTNAHVVDGADEIYVRLMGATRDMRARVVGIDPATDIALLRVRARGLQAARVGDSAALRVGDWVAAIGSPFGFDHTITAGIVSAKERSLSSAQTRFLQTDVAINPGSSGGPLVNLRGEVVGINSKIYTRTGGYMGVSFAIPIETAIKVSSELRRQGHVARGYLGVELQAMNDALASSFGLDAPGGALVTAVAEGSPAKRAGVQTGDVILAFRGKRIADPADLVQEMFGTSPGSDAEVELWRKHERLHAAIVVDSEPRALEPRSGSESGVDASARSAVNGGLIVREHVAERYGLVRIAARQAHGGADRLR